MTSKNAIKSIEVKPTANKRKGKITKPVPNEARVPAAAIADNNPARARFGFKVRHLRRTKGLRLKDLASAVGCSESMISKIETDKVYPSLVMLHNLVTALGSNIGEIFSNQPVPNAVIERHGQRPVIMSDALRPGFGIMLERLIPYSQGHLLQANVHIVTPGGKSEGAIFHQGEELGYVVEGQLNISVDGMDYHLEAGDSFYFNSNLPHAYHNPGSTTARVVWVNTPPTF